MKSNLKIVPLLVLILLILTASAPAQRAIQVEAVAKSADIKDGQRWALIVGINNYSNVPALKFARKDAQMLAQTLVEKAGFNPNNVVLLTDAENGKSPQYPTRDNLRAHINQIAQAASKKDILLIIFSGHGVKVDGKGYLVPVDGSAEDDGSLIPLSWVKETLESSPAHQRLLILDVCHSEAKAAPSAGAIDPSAAFAGAAFLTLASCKSQQVSYEDEQTGHGVFASALNSGLAGEADTTAKGNQNGIITAEELFHYASLRVKQWSLKTGKAQTPVLEGKIESAVELVRLGQSPQQIPSLVLPQPVSLDRKPTKVGDTITNSIGMVLTYIPTPRGGVTTIGSPRNEYGRLIDEDQHQVRIDKSFMMGVTEVTQKQWKAVMDTSIRDQRDTVNPSWPIWGEGDDYPMFYVSWYEAQDFCKKLSQKEGRHYRLPTEGEWEYACRAGTTTSYSFGDTDRDMDAYGWYRNNSKNQAHPVGQKKPNGWGLYDMHGNVWELCEDWYGVNRARILRGGSWIDYAHHCRSARRIRNTPDPRSNLNGFRVLLDLPE